MNPFRIAIAAFSIGLMTMTQCVAQQPETGKMSGHVVDSAGAIISKANVFVRRNTPSEDSVRLVTHTDSNGDFTLTLPEGGYDVLVTSPGFASSVKTVPIFRGKAEQFRWALKVVGCDIPGVNCDRF